MSFFDFSRDSPFRIDTDFQFTVKHLSFEVKCLPGRQVLLTNLWCGGCRGNKGISLLPLNSLELAAKFTPYLSCFWPLLRFSYLKLLSRVWLVRFLWWGSKSLLFLCGFNIRPWSNSQTKVNLYPEAFFFLVRVRSHFFLYSSFAE